MKGKKKWLAALLAVAVAVTTVIAPQAVPVIGPLAALLADELGLPPLDE